MEREIKFRGKRNNNGEWVYGSLIQLNSGLCYITTNIHGLHLPLDGKLICEFTHQVNSDTVGQYTGLKDKNSKKIFEGDIWQGLWKQQDLDRVISGPIIWADKMTGWCIHDKIKDVRLIGGWKYMTEGEVIGNVHDNPELLNKGI